MSNRSFKNIILNYYRQHKRNFSWRRTSNPYRILVSEIMLQQTQTGRVLQKYDIFLKRFPNFSSLAKSPLRDVLTLWQGLGYNRRAQNLKKCAEIIVKNYNKKLPASFEELQKLPGIGPATASAIVAFAFNKPSIFIETNIRTVFLNFFFKNSLRVHDKKIIPFIKKTLDTKNPREWYYGLMDYGAMLKNKYPNPNRKSLHYHKQTPFKNSERCIRGLIIKTLLVHNVLSEKTLAGILKIPVQRIHKNLQTLERDGLIKKPPQIKEAVFMIHN